MNPKAYAFEELIQIRKDLIAENKGLREELKDLKAIVKIQRERLSEVEMPY
jgi:predicted N-formylglutamate amidohydrolase